MDMRSKAIMLLQFNDLPAIIRNAAKHRGCIFFTHTASRVKRLMGSNSWSCSNLLTSNPVSIPVPRSQASKTLYFVFNLGPPEHNQGPHVLKATSLLQAFAELGALYW